mgnify:FL=1
MYSTDRLNEDIDALVAQGAQAFTLGYSFLGREIRGVFKGSPDGAQILMQGAMHAREWATAQLCVELFARYSGSVGVWCIPMTNPDGAMLAQFGLDSVSDPSVRDRLYAINGYSDDFSLWKANCNAVDLNVNFNALWGTGVNNVFVPAPSDYVGEYPFSEIETRDLALFTCKIMPECTVSMHARGEVIYKGFGCRDPEPELAARVAESCGYPLLRSEGSAGGYKDWFVATAAKLGLTVEVGSSSTPYPELQDGMDALIARTENILPILAAHYGGQI